MMQQFMSGASLLRRGIARTGEIGAVAGFADAVGLFPSFSEMMSVPATFVGFALIAMSISAVYDCIELAVKPDISARRCGIDENELP